MAEDDVPLLSAQYSANEGSDGGSPTVTGLFRPEDSVNEPSMDFSSMSGQNGSRSNDVHPYTPPKVEEMVERYITCQICQSTIPLKSTFKARVVKCPRCQEGTPIKEPPPGKKYIRCPCNCLLVCSATAKAVLCPRDGCNRKTQLTAPTPAPRTDNKLSFRNSISDSQVLCPHCLFGLQIVAPRSRYIQCTQCKRKLTLLNHKDRSKLLLRYSSFLFILALLLATGILIFALVPGPVWEPLITVVIVELFLFPYLLWKFVPLCFALPLKRAHITI